jgi:hypothetical protein
VDDVKNVVGLDRGCARPTRANGRASSNRTMLSATHGHNLSVVMARPYLGMGLNDGAAASSDIARPAMMASHLWMPRASAIGASAVRDLAPNFRVRRSQCNLALTSLIESLRLACSQGQIATSAIARRSRNVRTGEG